MQSPDEVRQEVEALRNRISKLSAAILRISVSLDVRTVLQEIFVPCGGFRSWPESNNCTLSGSVRESRSETKKGRRFTRRPFFDHYHE